MICKDYVKKKLQEAYEIIADGSAYSEGQSIVDAQVSAAKEFRNFVSKAVDEYDEIDIASEETFKKYLEQKGYAVIKITPEMSSTMDKCVEMESAGKDMECQDCVCNICIMNH